MILFFLFSVSKEMVPAQENKNTTTSPPTSYILFSSENTNICPVAHTDLLTILGSSMSLGFSSETELNNFRGSSGLLKLDNFATGISVTVEINMQTELVRGLGAVGGHACSMANVGPSEDH